MWAVPLPGAPGQPGGHRSSPDNPRRKDPSPWELSLRGSPSLSFWIQHSRLRVLQAPGFYFHQSTCHVVLSVHQHVFLEGQAPSDVRGTGVRQAGATRYRGKEQENLELFPTWLVTPITPGIRRAPLYRQLTQASSCHPHSPLVFPSSKVQLGGQSWLSHPTSRALACLAGPSQGLLRGHRRALPRWAQMTRAQRPQEQGQWWSCSGRGAVTGAFSEEVTSKPGPEGSTGVTEHGVGGGCRMFQPAGAARGAARRKSSAGDPEKRHSGGLEKGWERRLCCAEPD